MRTLTTFAIAAGILTMLAVPVAEAQSGEVLGVVRPDSWGAAARAERPRSGLFRRAEPQQSRPVGFRALMEAQPPAGYERAVVPFRTSEPAGTIIIDSQDKFLYLVQEGGTAMRYGIGVGREGFEWAGRERISRKAEWPSWRPPAEMLQRDPTLPTYMDGGIRNPLGARALYLGSTLYRIHGTNEPWTIGTAQSSGCIRMTNRDVMDLYQRTRIGAPVIVLGPRSDRALVRRALGEAPASRAAADARAEAPTAQAAPAGPMVRILTSAPRFAAAPAPAPRPASAAAPAPQPVAAAPPPAVAPERDPPPAPAATASQRTPPTATAPIAPVERTALPAPGTPVLLRSTIY